MLRRLWRQWRRWRVFGGIHKLRRRLRATSVAADMPYPAFCAEAARSDEAFRSFKRSPIYRRVLEHASEDEGAAYLDVIKRQAPALLADYTRFAANDTLGAPITFDYPAVGSTSPTTLRYVKVSSDLEQLFGDTGALDVIEIGGGYGGQCFVHSQHTGFRSYTLVDLPEALALARRYLESLGVDGVRYATMAELPADARYDLALSNYAFTECVRSVQEVYLARVLLPALRGYVTCNWIAPARFRCLTRAELLSRIPGATEMAEEPLVHPDNVIVHWGASAETRP